MDFSINNIGDNSLDWVAHLLVSFVAVGFVGCLGWLVNLFYMRKRTFFSQPSHGRTDGEFATRERFRFTLKRVPNEKGGQGVGQPHISE